MECLASTPASWKGHEGELVLAGCFLETFGLGGTCEGFCPAPPTLFAERGPGGLRKSEAFPGSRAVRIRWAVLSCRQVESTKSLSNSKCRLPEGGGMRGSHSRSFVKATMLSSGSLLTSCVTQLALKIMFDISSWLTRSHWDKLSK